MTEKPPLWADLLLTLWVLVVAVFFFGVYFVPAIGLYTGLDRCGLLYADGAGFRRHPRHEIPASQRCAQTAGGKEADAPENEKDTVMQNWLLVLALVRPLIGAAWGVPGAAVPAYDVRGVAIHQCSCPYACPCMFENVPMKCALAAVYHLDSGTVGGVDVAGLSFVSVDGVPPDGGQENAQNGVVYLDSRATPAQRRTLLLILKDHGEWPNEGRPVEVVPIQFVPTAGGYVTTIPGVFRGEVVQVKSRLGTPISVDELASPRGRTGSWAAARSTTCATPMPVSAGACPARTARGLCCTGRIPEGEIKGLAAETLSARYEIIETVSEADTLPFTVAKARDTAEDRVVTLQTLPAQRIAGSAAQRAAFVAAAQQAGRLDHPNIARVYDQGTSDGGDLYVAGEFVRGITLKERIRRIAPFSLAVAADIAVAVAEALEQAHAAGVAHGDLRPHNVLLSPEGQIKVAGFAYSRAAALLTADGPDPLYAAYAAPEIGPRAAGSVATDIYALGATLYEMLTGAQPAQGGKVPPRRAA